MAGGTRPCPTGRGSWSCRPAAGCRGEPSSSSSSFAALELLASLVQQRVTCVTRLRLDAALYEPAPPRQPKAIGRPRTKGERLPTLATVLADQATQWQRMTVPDWYGEGERVVEICSKTALWRHGGLPVVPIRRVLLRDPSRRFDPQALLCTDLAQEPLQVLRWFPQRWQLEVTFREARDHLGVETQRQWSDQAITRTTPCLLGLFSVVTLLAAVGTSGPNQPSRPPSRLSRGLVPQAAAHLRRHARRGSVPTLARAGLPHVPAHMQADKTPPRSPRRHRPCALLRRVNGQSRAKEIRHKHGSAAPSPRPARRPVPR